MPALLKTEFTAEVVWLGSLEMEERDAIVSVQSDAVELTFAGIAGGCHEGLTRPSCSRVKAQYPKGTEIKNERQLCIVSEEELAQIAAAMGVDSIDPARLGASMVVRGLPDFSHIPPSSRLQAPSGATVTVDMENRPCQFPAMSLREVHGDAAKQFKPAAEGRRGVMAWVAAEGTVAVGDTLTLSIPDQPAWAP